MTEPTDPLKALIQPLTGDLPGAWGTAALNPNFGAIGGMLGGSQTLSLSTATTFSLSAPAGAITPGAGPSQAQNFMLQFTGTLSGNAAITLPLPGFYVVFNNCTVGANYIQFRAVGTGLATGIPQGRQVKVWCDGTNVGLCDQAEVGSYLDLAAINYPAWYNGCINNALATAAFPYLICDASTYSFTQYPALAAVLGSTFGGNGITTFGVPDLHARVRIPLGGGSARVTTAGSGIDGTTLGAAGGDQRMQQHTHTTNESPHSHGGIPNASQLASNQTVNFSALNNSSPTGTTAAALTGLTINNAGSGLSQNMQPTLVAGIALIKT